MSDISNIEILKEIKKQSNLLEKILLNVEMMQKHQSKSEEIDQINSIFGQLMQSIKPKNEHEHELCTSCMKCIYCDKCQCVEEEDEIEEND